MTDIYQQLKTLICQTCNFILPPPDVFVPDDRVLGPVGQGYKIAIQSLNEGRIGIAAQMLGLAKGAFDCGVRYAAERQQFGKPTTDFQGMRFQIAQARTDIEALQCLIYNAAMYVAFYFLFCVCLQLTIVILTITKMNVTTG